MTREATPRIAAERARRWAALAVVFAASRVVFYLAGVRFDWEPLARFFQYIDPALLRSRLLESVWYLHGQPPLFNLYLGAVLKAFPGAFPTIFHLVNIAFGLLLLVAFHESLVFLGVRRDWRWFLTLLLLMNPTAILLENWLFYEYAVAALLMVSAWLFLGYASRGGWALEAGFFAALAAIAMTRTLFHLVWFLALAFLAIRVRRAEWHRVAACACIPAAIVAGLYLKNYVLFGSFSSSSWLGMSLNKIASLYTLSDAEKRELVRKGVLSEVSLITPFSPLERYREHMGETGKTGIPVLDEEVKSTGWPNLNCAGYLTVSRLYGRDARRLLLHKPSAYLEGIARAGFTCFRPTLELFFFEDNRRAIAGWERAYSLVVYGQPRLKRVLRDSGEGEVGFRLRSLENLGFFLVAGYGVVVFGGLSAARRAWRSGGLTRPQAALLVYLWCNVVYILAMANLFEVDENQRMRFLADPMMLAFLGFLTRAWGRRTAGGDQGGGADDSRTEPIPG